MSLDSPLYPDLNDQQRLEAEAAAFPRWFPICVNGDVQNIDLMNLAGFCRNCLSKWYASNANALGADLDKASARELIYGMPYEQWKAEHQRD